MAYDGITPLNAAVANLIKCSPKNNNKLAKVIGQAKIDLNITSKARKLPTEINLQIYTHLVELYSHTPNFNNLRVAFYTVRNNKRERQVISLDGYFINALASIKVSKQDVPQWIQAQVNEWTAFDSQLPITRQVKYLIMREVVKSLSGSDDLFHAPVDG